MFLVVEYDDGPCGEWEFETREEAENFKREKYDKLNPEIYWVKYVIEEV